jgi:PhoPQ-activated pathogenicity-related protein
MLRGMNSSKSFQRWLGFAGVVVTALSLHAADPLERYVAAPDDAFKWEVKSTVTTNGFTTATLSMTSQHWRTSDWTHVIQVVRPAKIRHPEIALLFITGDKAGPAETLLLAKVAAEAGATAAVVTRVPNQPLYGGKKEDALIAYTFLQ